MTILITGATGSIGRHVVADLASRAVPVRALTRKPADAALPSAAEIVEGSLGTAPASAFDGVDAVYLFPAADGVEPFIDRAMAAGVTRFVVLSSLAVSGRHARDAGSSSGLHHTAVERAVTSRTTDWTMLRAGNLANNLLFWSFPIRSGHPVRVPFPTSSQVLLHERDVAAAAVIALTTPGHEGAIYELTGPQSLTKVEQLKVIADAVGHDVPSAEITADEFRSDIAAYMSEGIIDMLLRYWSETVDEPEAPLPPVLGIEPTPLAQWATDHAAAFGG